ncbi:5-(carboxyamino)imidazole ribonucleotide mutase [Candidatus Micrarchaeota archaeon]|nr:5-(carboxyamino)imidazole ribonucleotide mutase [Candidatus Micrarchaeota archaeon]MBD3417620.1 5-(carboxyamino)imidazole ribonucleotide mutase [Candidatus Micrarchaeota archaeon]
MAERILVISGSKSDEKIVKKITDVLEEFEVEYKYEVASAHRTPEKVEKLVKSTFADAIIAVAGLSAALPGVIAAHTLTPVIGVPVSAKLEGMDALLSIAQMPPGIPVAAVGIDNGKNAALLALQILALQDKKIEEKLVAYREKMKG